MKLKLPKPADVRNKKVLLRVDYNVPLRKIGGASSNTEFEVVDDIRIKASLKTIQFLLENNARVIIISHLGRPKDSTDFKFSLKPVAEYLKNNLKTPINFSEEKITTIQPSVEPGQILLLENLRFYPGEKKNDPDFAKSLANLAEIYINDAFSVAHRSHASVVGVTKHLPSFAGFSLSEEVKQLSGLMENPKRPLAIVLGGAKISDKVGATKHLAQIADTILIGGAVANNFLKAEGLEIYRSFLEDKPVEISKEGTDYVQFAQKLIDDYKTEKVLKDNYIPLPKIIFPFDVVAAPTIDEKNQANLQFVDLTQNMKDQEEEEKLAYFDIGPNTTRLYKEIIKTAGTVFWNGPMGVWENPLFATGTEQVALAIAKNPNSTIVGGGDTIAAINHFGLEDHFKYISIAGGATLDFLSGEVLPGIKPLISK